MRALTPEQIDILVDKYIIGLYQEMEREIIADIARRVKKTGRYTETAELMAKSMVEQGYSASKIQAEVMKLLRADKAYQMAVAENTKAYKRQVQEIIDKTLEEEMRNRKQGYIIKKMSKNANISENAAKDIYQHIFIKEHIFQDGSVKRFDPDYHMAELFRRILEGKDIKPHDIVMLKHEKLELSLMKKYNMVYEEAHSLAETKYSYNKALNDFLKELGS